MPPERRAARTPTARGTPDPGRRRIPRRLARLARSARREGRRWPDRKRPIRVAAMAVAEGFAAGHVVEQAEIVLTADERLVRPDPKELFFKSDYDAADEVDFVHPELADDPDARAALAQLGITSVDAAADLENLLRGSFATLDGKRLGVVLAGRTARRSRACSGCNQGQEKAPVRASAKRPLSSDRAASCFPARSFRTTRTATVTSSSTPSTTLPIWNFSPLSASARPPSSAAEAQTKPGSINTRSTRLFNTDTL